MPRQVHKEGGRSSQVRPARLVMRAKDIVPKDRSGGKWQFEAYYRSGFPGSTIKQIDKRVINGATRDEAKRNVEKHAGRLSVEAKRKNQNVVIKKVGF